MSGNTSGVVLRGIDAKVCRAKDDNGMVRLSPFFVSRRWAIFLCKSIVSQLRLNNSLRLMVVSIAMITIDLSQGLRDCARESINRSYSPGFRRRSLAGDGLGLLTARTGFSARVMFHSLRAVSTACAIRLSSRITVAGLTYCKRSSRKLAAAALFNRLNVNLHKLWRIKAFNRMVYIHGTFVCRCDGIAVTF